MLTVEIVLQIFFSIYFLIHLLVVNPFLPHPSSYPSIPFSRLVLLAYAPVLPLCLSPAIASLPYLVSYTFATLAALRFTINAPLLTWSGVSLLHYPRLLLWRLDVLVYFVFFCLSVTRSLPVVPYIFLAFSAICTTIFDVYTRARQYNINASLQDVLFRSVHTIEQPQQIVSVPPSLGESSLFNILSFQWVTSTVVTGHHRPLQAEDILPLSHLSSTCTVSSHFKQFWDEECRLCPPKRPRLFHALLRAFGLRFIPGVFLGFCALMFAYLKPVLLRLIIIHLQNRENGSGESAWRGFLIACVLFAAASAEVALYHQYLNLQGRLENLVRAALVGTVYEKTTVLSPQSRVLYTSGQIQNLMAIDVQNIAVMPMQISFLTIFTEQICLCFFLLVRLVGWIPTLAAIGLIVMYVPLQRYLVDITKKIREAASSFTDERVKLISEAIRGIKLVKLCAWELSIMKRILQSRSRELHRIRKMSIVEAWNSVVVTSFPILLILSVFATYGVTGKLLDAAAVFPVVSLFNIIRPALNYLPTVLVNLARSTASLSRMRNFLCADELKDLRDGIHAVDQIVMKRDKIDLAAVEASFSWDTSVSPPTPTLFSVSFEIPEGSLVAVVGPTGSGKSTLLAALLGEVPILSGKAGIRTNRTVSFCDQIPFIQNATVRDNILFGNPFEEEYYRIAIRVCSLEPDLEILPGGDQTEIGSHGVNLSGGQRARIALARAVYFRSDIMLLDDPLCAVDAQVGRFIFGECIVSHLQGVTRLLTTNQIQYAASSAVDHVIVVKNGRVVESGSRNALLSCRSSEFAQLVEGAGEGDAKNVRRTEVEKNSVASDCQTFEVRRDRELKPNGTIKSSFAESSPDETNSLARNASDKDYGSVKNWKLTFQETKEEGRVRLKHYCTYLAALGPLRWVLPFLLFSLFVQIASLSVNLWLSFWSEQGSADHMLLNLSVFLFLGMVAVMVTGLSTFSLTFGSLRASKVIHSRLLLSVLGAPSSFFHSTPGGRVINRFHSDLDKVDSTMAQSINAFIRLTSGVVFAIGLLVWATPALALIVLPIAALCFYVQEFYRKSSVDIRRLQSLSRSPLYSHIGETLDGIATIRAFGNVSRGKHVNSILGDQLNKLSYSVWYANRWLAVRLESLSLFLIFTTVTLAVFTSPGRISASLTGLVLAYATQVLTGLTWIVRTFTEVESNLSSVERISEYSESPFPREEQSGLAGLLLDQKGRGASLSDDTLTELLSASSSATPAKHGSLSHIPRWPRKGRIEFDDVLMRYRSDLEPALKNVSFSVEPGEHIGIVGRTGAGKTSTIQCLFRLHELERGRILIDGTDISTLRLFDLRSSLGIIPQEPLCFSGTVRSNLDMQGDHDDSQVQEALDSCGLQATMTEHVSLDDEVSENGNNFSVGQRQLLCLGRALLKSSHTLILDEATSNVTNEIDEAIQKTLEEKMQCCTVLTIAHRLHTVMKCDRIIVMDKGRIAEIGKPGELLKQKSWLKSLVDETGHETAACLRNMALLHQKGNPERITGDDISYPETRSE